MKVLHLFKNYYPPTRGGVEQWINGVVHSSLATDHGIEFAVLTASTGRKLAIDDDDGVTVVRAPTVVRASTAPIVPSWGGWIRRLRPDVLHVHMPNPTGELAALTSRFGGPIVAHYHADIIRSGPAPAIYERWARRFVKRVQRVAVGSPRLAETTPALRSAAGKISIIPYGVDVDRWTVRPPGTDDLRRRYPGPLLVFVGRLRPYKGVPVLVEAMRDVDATLLVVGEGPQRAEIEATIERFGVGAKVHLIGEVADADRARYYHAADLFVLPSVSRAESYGIVQVEAMATGTPSVCTEIGTGTSWVNQSGETGLVVPTRDPHSLAAAVRELLADDSRREAMGAAAQRRVREHLSRDRMLDELRRLYEDAVSQKR